MKKFFLFLFFLLVLAGIGLAIFIVRFDVDKYRPLAEQKIEEALGKPADIGSLSLSWDGGIALSLRNLVLYADPAGKQEWLRLPAASAIVDLGPLLKRRLEITSIHLKRPSIELVKSPGGRITAFQKTPAGSSPVTNTSGTPAAGTPIVPPGGQSSAQPPAAAAVLPFMLDYVKVEDAEITFRDESRGPDPMILKIYDADLTLQNVSLNEPVEVRLRAGVFSREQNVLVDGKLRYEPDTQTFFLDNIHAETDLDKIRFQQLYEALPELRTSGIQEMDGLTQVDINSLRLDPKGMKEFEAKLSLEGGKLGLAGLRSPVENITLDVQAAKEQIQIRGFNADYAGGKINATGTVSNFSDFDAVPLTAVQANISGLSLDRALPEARQGQPSVEGILEATFQGTLRGKSRPVILQSLSGQGQIQIQDPVVRNLNVLREVFAKLSMLPGLMSKLREKLPESYNERLNQKDTLLAPINLPFIAQNGIINIQNLSIATDTFIVQGPATLTTEGRFLSRSVLRVEPELSGILAEIQPEFKSIANRQGELEFPLTLQEAQPYVIPDFQFLATRLVATKTQELLNDFLSSRNGTAQNSDGTTTAGSTSTSDQTASGTQAPAKLPKARDLFSQLLQSALTPQGQTASSGNSDSYTSQDGQR